MAFPFFFGPQAARLDLFTSAVVLTFSDLGLSNYDVPGAYGDRVTALNDGVGTALTDKKTASHQTYYWSTVRGQSIRIQ